MVKSILDFPSAFAVVLSVAAAQLDVLEE